MIFLWSNNDTVEEEEDEDTGLNDDLLAELAEDDIDEDLAEGEDVILPAPVIDPVVLEEEEDPEEVAALLDSNGDEDEEDMEYDSFDDKDEM